MTNSTAHGDGATAVPPNDHRPNSGLREGDIPHAEVNTVVREAEKTVIFGQQNRLRLGYLMTDEQLSRFYAGHDLAKFFYSGIRQIPEYLLNAILANGISVTLVKGTDMLVFHNVRLHQSIHTGRTRKTIYMPEEIINSAFRLGYDYWALSEVIIQEAWPLLDYLLILEFIRRCQQRLHQKNALGHSFIKDTLRQLNKHRGENADDEENEYALFVRHYHDHFFGWDQRIQDLDPHELADEIFDESMERTWADIKIDSITHAYNFPTFFNLDRDIVHTAVHELATKRGQSTDPQTVEDLVHDLYDAARFKVNRQLKTDGLLDRLLEHGVPGIKGLVGSLARERATSRRYLTEDPYDGYDVVEEFKNKLQEHSSSPAGSVGRDFDDLLGNCLARQICAQFQKFKFFPSEDQLESRYYLRNLTFQALGLMRPDLDQRVRREMIDTPSHWSPAQQVARWMEVAEQFMDKAPPDQEQEKIFQILHKLDLHPLYRRNFLGQMGRSVREATVSPRAGQLHTLVPDRPYRLSSDPQAVNARLLQVERLRKRNPDSEELLPLLAGILIRLDQAPDYAELVEHLQPIDQSVQPVLREIVDQINPHDTLRRDIRQTALSLLQDGLADSRSGPREARVTADESTPPRESRVTADEPTDEDIIRSFYSLIGQEPDPGQVEKDKFLYAAMQEEGYTPEDIVYAIKWTVDHAPDAVKFNKVILSIAAAIAEK